VPEFRVRVTQLRAAMTERVLGLLAEAAADAALTLHGLLDSNSEATRLKASDAILNHHLKTREAVELEQRISHLEGRQS
jgi:hypothetical protein